LFGQVLVSWNLLLADVVDEGLSSVHIYHHDFLDSLRRRWVMVVGAGSGMDDA
jgi:hypothetical protein